MKISTIRAKIEPTLIAVLMAEHSRLGRDSVIPTDVATLVARQIHKDVSQSIVLRSIHKLTIVL